MYVRMYEHVLSISGVDETSFRELLSQTQTLTSLCLRDTHLNDEILHCFSGSSLKMLDVSNTMVSNQIYGNWNFFSLEDVRKYHLCVLM